MTARVLPLDLRPSTSASCAGSVGQRAMNVLFLSPSFPPQYWLFCAALRARGVSVVAIGETPYSELRRELRDALKEYVFVPDMQSHGDVHRATAHLVARHGRIDRVASHNEHWLPLEARLRDDFGIEGMGVEQTTLQRSKRGMATLFAAAGIPHPVEELVESLEQVRRFAADHGLPLIFKPDVGVGAARTYRANEGPDLERILAEPLDGYIVQPFVAGAITTYDGLVDRDGRIVFATSHRYDRGMMEVLTGSLDGYYWSRRDLPQALEDIGQRAVTAFGLRERFFHAEFFELPGESGPAYRALEMNLRPPGGFTTDLMNFACDIDVYALWADIVVGRDVSDFAYTRKYHAAHAGRRNDRRYAIPHDSLQSGLGETLVLHQAVPAVFATSMGDVMYLLRNEDEATLLAAIARVQMRA